MEPKEKAKELVEKYRQQATIGFGKGSIYPIECAKIAVDEIISVIPMYRGNLNPKWKFWDDVKTELNKL